jgi:protein TonB
VAPEAVAHNEEQATATAIPDVPVNTPDPPAPESRRESYLLRLLAHIDAYKFYPRSARRRGLEGEVQVAFHLHADGSISELQVRGGSKLLRQAAKRAVQQALTLPPPPASVRLQEQIRFAMVYRLDG